MTRPPLSSIFLSTATRKKPPKKNGKMKAMSDKIKHLQRSLNAKNAQIKQLDEQLSRVQAEYLRYRAAVQTVVARQAVLGVQNNKGGGGVLPRALDAKT